MVMKQLLALLMVLSMVNACGSGNGEIDAGTRQGDIAEVMSLALLRLVTVDNTFGADHRFTQVLILESTDPQAGDGSGDTRALTPAEKSAIESALSSVGSVRWIQDPDEYRTADLLPTVEGSAIVGVGEPEFDADGALVPVSLWCGGLCGTWFTYRLVFENDAWQVEGPEGPIAIS